MLYVTDPLPLTVPFLISNATRSFLSFFFQGNAIPFNLRLSSNFHKIVAKKKEAISTRFSTKPSLERGFPATANGRPVRGRAGRPAPRGGSMADVRASLQAGPTQHRLGPHQILSAATLLSRIARHTRRAPCWSGRSRGRCSFRSSGWPRRDPVGDVAGVATKATAQQPLPWADGVADRW